MSKNTIELNAIGSKVKLEDDVYGIITAIHITDNNAINYEVGWWNGRSYTKEVFSPQQITVTVAEKLRIGFA
jgi:uncharacterized protein YodC (DUF2158 family)